MRVLCLLLLDPDDFMLAHIGLWGFYVCFYWILNILCLLLLGSQDFMLAPIGYWGFCFASIAYWGFCFTSISSWGFNVSFYWHLMILCLLILISEGFYVCCYWFLGTLCLLLWSMGILCLLTLVCGDFIQNTMYRVLLLTRDFYFADIAYWGLLWCSYCLLGILFDSYYLLWIFIWLLLLTMDCYFAPIAYWGFFFFLLLSLDFYLPFKLYRIYVYLSNEKNM